MENAENFYINGRWVSPEGRSKCDVINPTTEEVITAISLGTAQDVDEAVQAAKTAFASFSQTSVQERLDLLDAIIAAYQARMGEIADIISAEMGAPVWLAQQAQAPAGLGHFMVARDVLANYEFEEKINKTTVFSEPIGVCGLITPWNWPINQIACKVAPALAAGCTMVLKPSEVAPLNAIIFTEILAEAGVPAGVFNLVNGDGPAVGEAISSHPDIDMVSFTGSTRAGVQVAKAAADTVKRVSQELGGKSANIILPDADLQKAVAAGVQSCFNNSGQSCNAPTRMLVHRDQHDEAIAIAKATAEKVTVGTPDSEGVVIGPVVSEVQFNRIQDLIQKAMDEGSELVIGGPGRPEGFNQGFFVKPTIFANVSNDMIIARQEVFGPVLAILPYDTEEEAIEIANDTPYGLSSYIQAGDKDKARAVAAQIRAGNVHLNGAQLDNHAPFGGYKQSGNGREWGIHGMKEFLEVKAVFGY
ncbi:MAG: aldehyde dehydrogenase family protein [Parvibaculales bacterium]